MPLPVYITVFQYPKCSTCKKALSWLEDHHLRYRTVDLVASPPSKEILRGYWKLSGERLEAFFNTSGDSYRAGNFKDRMLDLTKEQMLDAVQRRYPAHRYVMVDDKQRILTAMKLTLGERLVTVFARQGHYAHDAHDPANIARYRAADVSVDNIGDLLELDPSSWLGMSSA